MKDLYTTIKELLKDDQLLIIILLAVCFFIAMFILVTIDYKGLHC